MQLTDELTDTDRANLTDAEIAAIEGREDDLDPDLLEAVVGDDETADEEPETPETEPAARVPAVVQRPVNTDRLREVENALQATDEQRAALGNQIADLQRQYADGDLFMEDYFAQVDDIHARREALSEQRQDLKLEHAQLAERVAENEAAAQQAWEAEQRRFFGRKDNADFRDDRALFGALDAEVKTLARDPRNADRSARWVLEQAAKNVRSAQGSDSEEQHRATQRSRRGTSMRDDFAALDALEGAEYEAALARLERENPDAAQRYAVVSS